MSTIKQYFNAVIKQQNPTWNKMYEYSIETFSETFTGINQNQTIRKCAKAYTICYNAIFSGTYNGLSLNDVCIPDVEDCVVDYFNHKKIKHSAKEVRQVVYQIYSDLYPDANITFEEIEEFTYG